MVTNAWPGCCCAQIGTTTAYAGLTLGGVLATSAHGSGHQTQSGIWDTLLEITWVDGTGKVCEGMMNK